MLIFPDESSATLKSTSTMHDTLNTIMDTSKQLIIALEKSDWLDRLLILSGLGFFLLVVLFILKQRIVDRGLRIAFWWTRFLPDVKLGGGRSPGLEVRTVLTAATTTASAALTASSTALSSLRTSTQLKQDRRGWSLMSQLCQSWRTFLGYLPPLHWLRLVHTPLPRRRPRTMNGQIILDSMMNYDTVVVRNIDIAIPPSVSRPAIAALPRSVLC